MQVTSGGYPIGGHVGEVFCSGLNAREFAMVKRFSSRLLARDSYPLLSQLGDSHRSWLVGNLTRLPQEPNRSFMIFDTVEYRICIILGTEVGAGSQLHVTRQLTVQAPLDFREI